MSKKSNSFEMSQAISYTVPRLHTGKEWYISFKAFDPVEGSLRLKRIKLNHIQKITERRKYAADLIDRLLDKLRQGWSPFIESEGGKAYSTFEETCELYKRRILKYWKDDIIREDTYVCYMSYLRNLQQYNKKLKRPITYIYQLDRTYINDFLEHIYIDRENSAQTRDNYLTWMRVFARWLVKMGYHKTVATDGIDVLGKRSRKKTRTVIPDDQLIKLKEYVSGHNKHYLLACYLLYYCFIRPKEMSLIKIGDISIKNRTIFIPEDNSKNRKSAVVTVNVKILELMIDLGIFSHPGDYYLFGSGYMPGKEYRSEKQFRDYWNHYVRKNLNFPSIYKFYSLKDTGVTTMLKQKIDNISVRDQARHSSILMTDTYTPHDIQEANPVIEAFNTIF